MYKRKNEFVCNGNLKANNYNRQELPQVFEKIKLDSGKCTRKSITNNKMKLCFRDSQTNSTNFEVDCKEI